MSIFDYKKEPKEKEYDARYRQRLFYCKTCDLYLQYFGEGEPKGKCHCCRRIIANMPLTLDQTVRVKRRVIETFRDPNFKG